MDKELDILQKIERAEPSPFLFTRILNAVEKKTEKVPAKQVWATGLALLVLLVLNISMMKVSNRSSESDLTEVFSLTSSNMLYHD